MKQISRGKIKSILIFILVLILFNMSFLRGFRNIGYQYSYSYEILSGGGSHIDVIGIISSGDRKSQIGVFTDKNHYNSINQIVFSIQHANAPLKYNDKFELISIIVSPTEGDIVPVESSDISFSTQWEFRYVNGEIPDHLSKDLNVSYKYNYEYPDSHIGVVRSDDKTKGSYFCQIFLSDKLLYPEGFTMNIEYSFNGELGYITIQGEPMKIASGKRILYLENYVKQF